MASLLSCNDPQATTSNLHYNAISPQPASSPPLPTMPTQPIGLPTPNPMRIKETDIIERKGNSGLYGEALLTLQATKERKSKTQDPEDEITIFGHYIAAQMRKFQPVLQSKLKLDIQTLLCKYEIDNLEYTSRSASSRNSVNFNINTLLNDESSSRSSPI
ncbi:unnamed protein product [Leptidea sinapis]|uniref:BESS domain-containing protein n=1 Tax=Leptidea sinapis TaxID=189913 RepID=A0A5E4Q9E9_9NEOP|nr:unnamed protein product [Leptidea sinapis]